jgi:hypothetical protein
MRLSTYTVSQKYIKNKHGDIGVYKKRIKKWIKSNQPYKPRKRGLQKLSIYSTRFGFLDLYNRKEQQELICPSGYSISQGFNVLRKLWYAYRRAIGTDKDIDKMKKYAKAIQDVQKDMGIKTASFPHLGLYGDALILKAKNGMRRVFEIHSAFKKKQEEYKTRQMKNNIKIQESLQKPNRLNGEAIVTLVDDVSPYEKQDNEVKVPLLLKPEKEKEEIQTLVDTIPFLKKPRTRYKRKGISVLIDNIILRKPPRRRLNRKVESASTIVDDVSRYEKQDNEITVPLLLKPDKEKEEIQTLVDTIPFRRRRRRRIKRNENLTLPISGNYFPYEKYNYEVTVPLLLKPDYEKEEEIYTLVDNTPFPRKRRRRINRNVDSSLPIPDDDIPDEELEAETEDTVPHMLEPEEDEEVLVFSDNIPFRS